MKLQSQRISAGSRGSIGSNNAGSKDRFSGRNAPDNCQVFIGNLPSGLDEKQVMEVFSSKCMLRLYFIEGLKHFFICSSGLMTKKSRYLCLTFRFHLQKPLSNIEDHMNFHNL